MKAVLSFLLPLCLLVACADTEGSSTFEKREFRQFSGEVYPVLLRDCGFAACHGAEKRFFRVYGPGRTRLRGEDGTLPEPLDSPTAQELSESYTLALSMIDPGDPKRSLLLRKPLSVEAGGAGHQGVDNFDRDVYRTSQDSGFLAIARWVYSPPPEPASP